MVLKNGENDLVDLVQPPWFENISVYTVISLLYQYIYGKTMVIEPIRRSIKIYKNISWKNLSVYMEKKYSPKNLDFSPEDLTGDFEKQPWWFEQEKLVPFSDVCFNKAQ